MSIPTEPIGSIPRPPELIEAMQAAAQGRITPNELDSRYDEALQDTIERFEATGSPVISDGEQTKPSFVTYPLHGLDNLAPDGVTIPFEDGHTRQLPRLTAAPFRYGAYADEFLRRAKRYAHAPVKQAVIAPSALSLLYPQEGIDGYPRKQFLEDLIEESATDVRRSLDAGAYNVQLDFTEGRLSLKLDPSHALLDEFIRINAALLERFSADERSRIGIHSCPGGDQDATHSLEVDYGELLPSLFSLDIGSFYLQLASEPDRARVLGIVKEHAPANARIFLGVTDPIDPRVETAEEVCDRVLEAAEYIPPERLGTCDDCGFSPFGDDTSTPRETVFEKIRARVEGTALAAEQLGLRD
jgi:5-methyltetrahydropteroyltriglutamate--homocysteine methyltransferase